MQDLEKRIKAQDLTFSDAEVIEGVVGHYLDLELPAHQAAAEEIANRSAVLEPIPSTSAMARAVAVVPPMSTTNLNEAVLTYNEAIKEFSESMDYVLEVRFIQLQIGQVIGRLIAYVFKSAFLHIIVVSIQMVKHD